MNRYTTDTNLDSRMTWRERLKCSLFAVLVLVVVWAMIVVIFSI